MVCNRNSLARKRAPPAPPQPSRGAWLRFIPPQPGLVGTQHLARGGAVLREPRTSLYVLSCAKRCQISNKSSWQRGRMLTKASPSASKGAEPQGCALQGARKGEVPAQQLGEPSLPQTLGAAKNGHRNLPGGLVRFCGSETQGRAAAVSQAAINSSLPPRFCTEKPQSIFPLPSVQRSHLPPCCSALSCSPFPLG